MLAGVHHVGQIVDDLEETVAFYRDILGGTVTSTGNVDGKVDVAFVELPEYRTELICRHERGTYLDDLLDELLEKPESHVAFVVDDIETAMASFEDAGYPMYDEEPVDGLGPYVRAFVDPGEVPGMSIELVEERSAD
jgi:methylmalonyl-CoA epimerase